ncbi:endo alpha-1,4 polygalactosaminidase [Microbacterium indicum]|uniref:endo alpha-1,4 polygalactosaminidase n=1 Tax=Microbacterium indicum TaxID=358100 RepID=UPI0004921638|nr:endo alpha-1,4 polygalactosaminidase [Microbacterium indicum]
MIRSAALALVPLALAACSAAPAASAAELPSTSGVFDYQLGATDDALADGSAIDVVVRDATADPLDGAYSVCYVNGFQTQPGEEWDDDALLHDADGEPVVDPDWPDEFVLDPSAPSAILPVITPMIEGCAEAGFDAAEIDNLDTFTRFDEIDEDDAIALAREYIDVAHEAGLAIGQKNAAEIAGWARDLGFDFAIAEECGLYEECGDYADAYGEHVLQIEYTDTDVDFDAVCASDDRAPLAILRDRDLVAQSDPDYAYAAC